MICSAEMIMYTVLTSAFSGTNQRTSFITGLRYVLLFQLIYFFFFPDPINSLRAGFYKFVELFGSFLLFVGF